ncbi:MAG: hypothetical protein U9R25_20490 [Chloroflexota bacterium]|nr:hypothetical protein [Chloroflexota bacterium]
MSVLTDYLPDEQTLLMEGPRLGAIVVSAASLGRKSETSEEGFAAALYVLESQGDYLDNTLISSIQYTLEQRASTGGTFADYTKLATAPDAMETSLAKLRQLVELLARKSNPEEAAGYKQWVMAAAVRTSEAGEEDEGFLGFGGVDVNDAEREALAQVAAALGIAE